jgi:SAM-dependent methyltransferase
MREDWDERARVDARFFVAFGRRRQTREEFLATAAEVLHAIKEEFRRLGSHGDLRRLSALEIGCGPGRLMLPLSQDFGKIQGVDVSGEMIALARENLAAVPHAEVYRNEGADLGPIADESIDFCYSYAVFQHIPDKEVVWNYLRETCRVLKPDGLLRFQFNGLPAAVSEETPPPAVIGWSVRAANPSVPLFEKERASPNTWSGVRFRPEELAAFAAKHGLQLLAIDRFDTQYLWLTAKKRPPRVTPPQTEDSKATIVRVTDTFTADAVVAQAGRYASASVWVLNLPDAADLNRLRVEIDGQPAAPCFIGSYTPRNPTQVNVYLPPGVRTGMVPVRLTLDGQPISDTATMRVIPPGPLVPRLVAVSDAVNLLSETSIESHVVKVEIEEVNLPPEQIATAMDARLDGRPVERIEVHCLDPLTRLFSFDMHLPEDVPAGLHHLTLRLGKRDFAPTPIHVTE